MPTPLPKLAAPARRALDAAGIADLEDLARHSAAEINQLHGMGPNALTTLRDALAEGGAGFRGRRMSRTLFDRSVTANAVPARHSRAS